MSEILEIGGDGAFDLGEAEPQRLSEPPRTVKGSAPASSSSSSAEAVEATEPRLLEAKYAASSSEARWETDDDSDEEYEDATRDENCGGDEDQSGASSPAADLTTEEGLKKERSPSPPSLVGEAAAADASGEAVTPMGDSRSAAEASPEEATTAAIPTYTASPVPPPLHDKENATTQSRPEEASKGGPSSAAGVTRADAAEEGRESEESGDEAFEDAWDTVGGMPKSAEKAQEMKQRGNECYKARQYEDAVDYYTMALRCSPDADDEKDNKAIFFANRAACHIQLEEWPQVVEDCSRALELKERYVKALMRRAAANEKLEKYDLALEDIKVALEVEPELKGARESVSRLEKLHAEKMEKLKDEAIGKLKELGNSVLGHFGMSLDNFQLKQDPETGSYSVNFQQGAPPRT